MNVRLLVDPSKKDLESVDHSKICMYCGYFANEHLEEHCNQDCLMLTNCPTCQKVVEARHLRDHVLYDCKQKFQYKICNHCHQPIQGNIYDKHRTRTSAKKLKIIRMSEKPGQRCMTLYRKSFRNSASLEKLPR
uniref:TRAF-type domain-containing protein n=1 Tax=Ditylenchus dipsaci TaxID=166011 RepID=A0A915DMK2_9BILA